MKDVGLRIRIEPELREEFIQMCHDKHIPAAQVLREFMRQYVQSNKECAPVMSKRRTSKKLASTKG